MSFQQATSSRRAIMKTMDSVQITHFAVPQPLLRPCAWFMITKVSVGLDLCVTHMFYTQGESYFQVVLSKSQTSR